MNIDIQPMNKKTGDQFRNYLVDTLTKPLGSLGRLEDLAIQLAEITGSPFPVVSPPGIIIFAADHGVTKEGGSAFPQEVTAQMVTNFLSGGSAINVMRKSIGAKLKIVDIGVAVDIDGDELINRKLRRGTANFFIEEALTKEEVLQAMEVGKQEAEKMIENEGIQCLIPGETGIGNTTASSAMLSVFMSEPVDAVTGRGTGIDNDRIVHKQKIIKWALEQRKPNPNDPIDVLSKVGGLEIAGIVGAIIAATAHRIPILLDGLISTTATIVAVKINSHTADYLIVGHRSAEPGHNISIQHLQKQPLLDLELRLREGSGSALAFPIVENTVRLLTEMATFESAGVSDKNHA